ncbi:hypothetical protein GH714_038759 [Hevea brasiliensis]|uniref:RecA family profile 2 domain-containing protein n=1 Tax=Hevea brasiliensis TaxID=3981 RepID=A0A6A6K8L0_HEVBR|nr:hypothetical protein GH714_038759 [Hevea brasiliensis]
MSNEKDNLSMADLKAVLNEEDRAGLVNALKNKLQTLAGQHTEMLENLSPNVRQRVEHLREIQSQHDELEAKFFEERAALEAKYQKLYQPLYTKRYEIVNGTVEVDGSTNEATMDHEENKAAEEKGVPDFWLIAMKNNEVLAEEITDRDEGALKYLKDIKWCRIDDPKGFKLEFFFDPNPYFKNTVLTKTYHMIDEDEPILEKAIGTEIEWYPGKCLTQKLLKKKPKKGSKNAKPITKTEDCESFFNFFNPPQVPEDDEDIDEDTAEELQNQMEQDYDIGHQLETRRVEEHKLGMVNKVLTRGILGMASQSCNFSTKGRRRSKSDGSESSEDNLSKKEVALQQALDQITSTYGKGSIMWFGRSIAAKDVPVVSTGSFALDIALGTGGLPKGRVVEIYGPEASGKTTLALHVIAEAQKQGGYCVFVDAEHALDSSLAQAIGVAALVPKSELDGEMGDAHMAMQARLMSQALRKLSHSLSLSQTILIFVNQVRSKLSTFGGFSGPTEVTCGGNALKFYASVRLNIRRVGLVKKGEETVGSQVQVKIVKNKLAPPFKTVQFELEFGKGICRESEIIDLGVKHKFLSRAGAFYNYNGQNFRGKEALRRFLAENDVEREELVMKLRQKLLDFGSNKEQGTEATDGEPVEGIISPDSTDEEVVTAVEA